jgi:arabinan endo-1,5-alpha-L-arabinosidase
MGEFSAASAAHAGSGGTTYHWPLTGNLGTHDPTLINENGTWWQFQTGVGIYGKVSRNGGLTGSILGVAERLELVENLPGSRATMWAPDVKVYNGRTYMYYSVSTLPEGVADRVDLGLQHRDR